MIPHSLSAIANHLWQSTLFAGLAGFLTLALRKNSARVRHWVWVAASLKFRIPFSVLVAVGSRIEWRTAPVIAANVAVAVEQVSQPFTIMTTLWPVLTTVPTAPDRLPAILFRIWACGFIGISISWCIQWRRISAAVRAGSPVQLDIPIRAICSPFFLEPGIFGVHRPVLLLPEGIFGQLTPEQWQAVLAHELCHLRRRDNLIGVVQIFVETVFWFHPLLWWVGKRILQERERACDEEVLRLGNEPRVYAGGILRVCELYLESPLECVAGVSGSNLRRRLRAIMTHRGAERMSVRKKLLLAAAGAFSIALPTALGVMSGPSLHAQSAATPSVGFEIASIKPDKTDEPSMKTFLSTPGGGEFQGRSTELKPIIEWAYGVLDHQLIGAPQWLSSERFNIDAKPGSRMGSRWYEDQELRARVRAFLAERCNLKAHYESKQGSIYNLVVAKGGPKVKNPAEDAEPLIRVGFDRGRSQISGQKLSVEMLAEALSRTLGRTVRDATNLSGAFALELTWVPDDSAQRDSRRPPPEGPSLFTAVQEQLGLRLESSKGPVQVLVIDHVELPSEN